MRIRLAILCAAALAPLAASATPARTAALQGSQLFEDDTDLFLYPGLAAHYANELTFSFGNVGDQGGFSLGQDLALGLFYNGRVVYHDLARTADDTTQNLLQPAPLVSFVAAKKSGDTLYGLIVNPALSTHRVQPPKGAGDLQHELAVDVEAILSMDTLTESGHSDSAVAISYHHYQLDSAGKLQSDTDALPSIALRHRSIMAPGGGGLSWGWWTELAHRDESWERPQPTDATESWDNARWVASLGVGPRIVPVERVTLAPSIDVDFTQLRQNVSFTFGSFTQKAFASSANLVLPSLKLALEAAATDWLVLRAGLTRGYGFTIVNTGDGGESQSYSSFGWSAGLGVAWRGLEVDTTIEQDLLLSGPYAIGGVPTGLFGAMSLRYHY